MPFPNTERVIFKNNPLDEVICQLRFPPILKIDAELPSDFQEKIRSEFPNYTEASSVKIEGPPKIRGAIPIEIKKQLDIMRLVAQSTSDKNHEFTSEDNVWKLTLSRTFIALTANKYERWEKFYEKLKKPLEMLIAIYAPAYFTRIGLRYVDVFKRTDLELGQIDWTELFKPFILGLLATHEMQDHIRSHQGTYEISLSDGDSIVRLATKLVETIDSSEMCFVIDSDFFTTKKTELEDTAEKLKYFNIRASRLIQWCITKKLYEALGPQAL